MSNGSGDCLEGLEPPVPFGHVQQFSIPGHSLRERTGVSELSGLRETDKGEEARALRGARGRKG